MLELINPCHSRVMHQQKMHRMRNWQETTWLWMNQLRVFWTIWIIYLDQLAHILERERELIPWQDGIRRREWLLILKLWRRIELWQLIIDQEACTIGKNKLLRVHTISKMLPDNFKWLILWLMSISQMSKCKLSIQLALFLNHIRPTQLKILVLKIFTLVEIVVFHLSVQEVFKQKLSCLQMRAEFKVLILIQVEETYTQVNQFNFKLKLKWVTQSMVWRKCQQTTTRLKLDSQTARQGFRQTLTILPVHESKALSLRCSKKLVLTKSHLDNQISGLVLEQDQHQTCLRLKMENLCWHKIKSEISIYVLQNLKFNFKIFKN